MFAMCQLNQMTELNFLNWFTLQFSTSELGKTLATYVLFINLFLIDFQILSANHYRFFYFKHFNCFDVKH